MARQTITGKAFEYALLQEFYFRLNKITKVNILENESFKIAKKCFDTFTETEKSSYRINSSAAVNFLIDIEPKLYNSINDQDILLLEIVPDKEGQAGDVRDVLMIRAFQKWEIGISAKNNHRAVKHSRLSLRIDFGEKWLGFPCSSDYFNRIRPVFNELSRLKKSQRGLRWETIANKDEIIYLPILSAFKDELLRIHELENEIVSSQMVKYLIGNQDFYKVIKGKNKLEIQAYNLHGTLNQPYNNIKPKAKIQRLRLPTRIVDANFEKDSNTTLIISFNEGWTISFRIHNASSRIEPSLKFDINLVSSPHSLFTNHIFLDEY